MSLGELLVNSHDSFHSGHHIQCSCLIIHGTAMNQNKFLQFKIPWSKTKFAQGEWITLTETFDDINPVAAIEHHLFVNSKCPSSTPLFSYETPSGWAPLTHLEFMD
jgi:hypothetical protein